MTAKAAILTFIIFLALTNFARFIVHLTVDEAAIWTLYVLAGRCMVATALVLAFLVAARRVVMWVRG